MRTVTMYGYNQLSTCITRVGSGKLGMEIFLSMVSAKDEINFAAPYSNRGDLDYRQNAA